MIELSIDVRVSALPAQSASLNAVVSVTCLADGANTCAVQQYILPLASVSAHGFG